MRHFSTLKVASIYMIHRYDARNIVATLETGAWHVPFFPRRTFPWDIYPAETAERKNRATPAAPNPNPNPKP